MKHLIIQICRRNNLCQESINCNVKKKCMTSISFEIKECRTTCSSILVVMLIFTMSREISLHFKYENKYFKKYTAPLIIDIYTTKD